MGNPIRFSDPLPVPSTSLSDERSLMPSSQGIERMINEGWRFSPFNSIQRSLELAEVRRESGDSVVNPDPSPIESPSFFASTGATSYSLNPTLSDRLNPVLPSGYPRDEAIGIDYLSREQVNDEFGIPGHLSFDHGITREYAQLLYDRKMEEIRTADAIDRTQSNVDLATGFGLSIAVSALDPINFASMFVPIVGEARFANMVAKHGKVGARLLRGGIEGSVGNALVEPIILNAAIQEGAAYDPVDSFINITFGGVLGAGLHTVGGVAADAVRGISRKRHEAALATAVAQFAQGKRVEVEDIVKDAKAQQSVEVDLDNRVNGDADPQVNLVDEATDAISSSQDEPIKFDDHKSGYEWLLKEANKINAKLSEESEYALMMYQGGTFVTQNLRTLKSRTRKIDTPENKEKFLQLPNPDPAYTMEEQWEQLVPIVEGLDAAMTTHDRPITVRRVLTSNDELMSMLNLTNGNPDEAVGVKFHDPDYMSTTSHFEDYRAGDLIFEIEITPGTKFTIPKAFEKNEGDPGPEDPAYDDENINHFRMESEITLDRGTELHITSASKGEKIWDQDKVFYADRGYQPGEVYYLKAVTSGTSNQEKNAVDLDNGDDSATALQEIANTVARNDAKTNDPGSSSEQHVPLDNSDSRPAIKDTEGAYVDEVMDDVVDRDRWDSPLRTEDLIDGGDNLEGLGSQIGKVLTDPQNRKWYVKPSESDPDRAINEFVAATLYRLAGLKTPDTRLVVDGDKATGVASRWNDDLVRVIPDNDGREKLKSTMSDEQYQNFLDSYAIHAWLGNRDVTGFGDGANIHVTSQGDAVFLDFGGALQYRGMGELKTDFNSEVSELEGFLDSELNNEAATIFKDVKKANIRNGVSRILLISEEDLTNVIGQSGLNKADTNELVFKLIERANYLGKLYPSVANKAAKLKGQVKFYDHKSGYKWLMKEADKLNAKLSDKSKEALESYQIGSIVSRDLRILNVRDKKIDTPENKQKYIDEIKSKEKFTDKIIYVDRWEEFVNTVEGLDDAMMTYDRSIIVRRVLKSNDGLMSALKLSNGNPAEAVGVKLHDNGYMSATSNMVGSAETGTLVEADVGIVLEIEITPGTKFTIPFAHGDPFFTNRRHFVNESEIVIGRGTQLFIKSARENDGVHYLKAVTIGNKEDIPNIQQTPFWMKAKAYHSEPSSAADATPSPEELESSVNATLRPDDSDAAINEIDTEIEILKAELEKEVSAQLHDPALPKVLNEKHVSELEQKIKDTEAEIDDMIKASEAAKACISRNT